MTMIEKVEAALTAVEFNIPDAGDRPFKLFLAPNDLRNLARAAIEAMREPTDAMVYAAPSIGNYVEDGKLVWTAMIDAALEGK